MEFIVPGENGRPELIVTVMRPAHSCDEMVAKFEPGAIKQVVHYIRYQCIDVDDLVNRRQYGGDALERGIWKNGSAGLVRKLERDGGECLDPLKK